MNVLVGTPIHEVKDYSMERWLENVARLQRVNPSDLLLVDNSPSYNYVKKVHTYCAKYKVTNYKIEHLDIDHNLDKDIRIEASQETIRQYALNRNYDAWFSWECDQIIPPDSLDKLVKIMKVGNYMMVFHNSGARWDNEISNTNMGCTLISRDCLEKNWFLPTKSGKISFDKKDVYNIDDPNIYKKRVIESGGNYIEVFGVIKPIYHLNNPQNN